MSAISAFHLAHRSRRAWFADAWARLRVWASAMSEAYETARIYDMHRHMSDAELRKRGLSRATLAHDLRLEEGAGPAQVRDRIHP